MGINFQNVNFKYDSRNKIETVKNISLNISSEGEFITILGHTGSGKSTLVQMMNALIFPSSGQLTIFNNSIKSTLSINSVELTTIQTSSLISLFTLLSTEPSKLS